MYERLGDARAFAVVQEHFRSMSDVIAKHGGAIVKTMGDAVMATFASPGNAMRAGVEMVEREERERGELGLGVKIGLHEGPCLAVRANERLDFFGTTVNVAARLQAQAHGGQIVVMESLLEHAEVAELVAARAMRSKRFQVELKGIRAQQSLVAFDARPGTLRESATSPAVATG
jgi:class 3 adenylate cyclase